MEKIDENIAFITMTPNSNPNTTVASMSLSNVVILEYNLEARSFIMADVISLLRVLECDYASYTSALLLCRLDAGGEELDEFGAVGAECVKGRGRFDKFAVAEKLS